jgi:hypothetical protein
MCVACHVQLQRKGASVAVQRPSLDIVRHVGDRRYVIGRTDHTICSLWFRLKTTDSGFSIWCSKLAAAV